MGRGWRTSVTPETRNCEIGRFAEEANLDLRKNLWVVFREFFPGFPREMFFISFSPGFNRVTTGYLISENRFNGLPPQPANSKPLKRFNPQKGYLSHPVETG